MKRKLEPSFASDYIIALKTLSRKHKKDDREDVKKSLRLLRRMSKEAFLAGRGETWIPSPDPKTGFYPIMENIPYNVVRRGIRANTKPQTRSKAWDAVASSVQPFYPLFAGRPGSEVEKSLFPATLVSLPFVKGRHPALLGKRVPGELEMAQSGADTGTRSIIPIRRMSPAEWEQGGFTMRRFNMTKEDIVFYQAGRLAWIKRRALPKLKGLLLKGALPVALGGATMAAARWAHGEVGIPPTTIGMEPVTRGGFRKEYYPYPNVQLRAIMRGLERRLSEEPRPELRDEMRKQIARLGVELQSREYV